MKKIGTPIDKVSFEEVFKLYYRPVCGYVRSLLRDNDAAEDIAQDCFIKLWNRRDQSIAEEAKAFLFITAKNATLNRMRKIKGNERAHRAIREMSLEIDDTSRAEAELIKAAVISLLYEAIERLSHAQRDTILASLNIGGKDGHKAARILNIPFNTYRTHRHEAFKSLRKIMGNIADEGEVRKSREMLKRYFEKMR